MERFCIYCGKPLAEGEECDCQASENQGFDPINPSQADPKEEEMESEIQVLSEGQEEPFQVPLPKRSLWSFILHFFKHPLTALESGLESVSTPTSFLFLVVFAACGLLFLSISGVSVGVNLYRTFAAPQTDIFSLFGFDFGLRSQSILQVNYGLLFLLAACGILIGYFLLCGITILFTKGFFKSECDASAIFKGYNVCSLYLALLLLLASVIGIFAPFLSFALLLFAPILGAVLSVSMLKGVCHLDQDRSFYVMLLCTIISAVLFFYLYISNTLDFWLRIIQIF